MERYENMKAAADELADSSFGEQLKSAPAITALQDRIRSICQGELIRLERKVPNISTQDRQELERMLHRIARKILDPAIMEWKAAEARANAADEQLRIGKLFGLDLQAPACP